MYVYIYIYSTYDTSYEHAIFVCDIENLFSGMIALYGTDIEWYMQFFL